MPAQKALAQRSNNTCELCTSDNNLSVYPVPPTSDLSAQQSILVCQTCLDQIEGKVDLVEVIDGKQFIIDIPTGTFTQLTFKITE